MSQNPILHVLVPDLLQPLTLWKNDFGFTPTSNQISRLLAKHKHQKVLFDGLDSSLFSLLGYPLDTELPIAFYRAKKEGLNETLKQYNGTLVCADPVHLAVGSSEVVMDASSPIDDLTESEADQLIDVLNKHFEQDGLQFIKGAHNRWYLLLGDDDSLTTTPLRDLRGKDVSKHLARSEKTNLHQLQNEAQMLLHSAEVNKRREQQGKLAVNSLWLWGGGTQTKARTRVRSVIGGGIHGETASLVAQCQFQVNVIEKEQALSQLPAGGHHILILDQLSAYVLNDDLEGWQQQLDKLEQQWFEPIAKLFNSGKLDCLVHDCNGNIFTPEKPSKITQLINKIKPQSVTLQELSNV